MVQVVRGQHVRLHCAPGRFTFLHCRRILVALPQAATQSFAFKHAGHTCSDHDCKIHSVHGCQACLGEAQTVPKLLDALRVDPVQELVVVGIKAWCAVVVGVLVEPVDRKHCVLEELWLSH